MPHQCTNCGRVFADGSKEMLSGCPNCGGNKFQFEPSSQTESTAETTSRREQSESSRDTSPSGRDAGAADDTATGRDATAEDRDATSADRGTTAAEDTTAPDDDAPSESETWKRAASRAAETDPDDGTAPDAQARTDRSRGTAVDDARRRGQSLREWANSRGFASEVDEDAPADADESKTGSAGVPTEARDRSTDSPARPESESDARPSTPETPSERPDPDAAEPNRSDDAADAPAGGDQPSDVGDAGVENDAQASARSDVVSPDEIRAASGDRPSDVDGTVIEPEDDDRPGLDELREELNDQFESIRIVAPGEYELNLMELYDRNEYIISLREDGRYVIEVPDRWDGPGDDG